MPQILHYVLNLQSAYVPPRYENFLEIAPSMGHEKLIISKLSTEQTIAEKEKNVQSLRHAEERK